MEDLSFLFKVSFQENLVGLLFGLGENDGSSMSTTVKVDNVGNDGISVIIWTI